MNSKFACRAAAVALAMVVLPAIVQAQPYFPERPRGVRVFTLIGTLVAFASGMNEGHVRVRDAHGRLHDFYRARDLSIDGQVIRCMQPPRAGFVPSKLMCQTWPPYIRFGETRVRVSWWIDRRGTSGNAAVADHMVTLNEALDGD